MASQHVRTGKKALQERQEAAGERAANRATLTAAEQIQRLSERPGQSKREVARLS